MSENRGIGTGREGKRREESLEGHASSSSQPADATGRRSPNIVPVNHPGGEIELGIRAPVYSGSPTRVGEKKGIFLFEAFVTPEDLDLGRLLIPVEAALDYFPISPNDPETYTKEIVICNANNSEWLMTLRYDRLDCFFAMDGRWRNFVLWNRVGVLDVVRFYKPVPISYDDYYVVAIVKRQDQENIDEFKPEDFLFQLQLSDAGILLERLFIPVEEVSNHFNAVGIPAKTHHMERLYFTDHLRRFWCIKITCHNGTFQLLMDEFIKAHNLEEGDMIMFYKPVRPLNSRHFLIHFATQRVTTPTQLGTAAVDDSTDRGGDTQGDGGGGTDRGGDAQGDGGGGRSRSGSLRMWWKSIFGGCCMAFKNNGRTEES